MLPGEGREHMKSLFEIREARERKYFCLRSETIHSRFQPEKKYFVPLTPLNIEKGKTLRKPVIRGRFFHPNVSLHSCARSYTVLSSEYDSPSRFWQIWHFEEGLFLMGMGRVCLKVDLLQGSAVLRFVVLD
jgi:hypothetical protein